MAHADIDKTIRSYKIVGVSLYALTVITVAVSYIELPPIGAVALGLAVALVKGTLVAGVFMHLFSEKFLIYWSLALTVFMFFAVLLGPLITELGNFGTYM